MQQTPDQAIQSLEDDVRRAVEEGAVIEETIRKLTLDAMRERSFDIASIRRTAEAVLRGARSGVQNQMRDASLQTQVAKERMKQAVTGLDGALAQFANAARLAVEEASGRAKHYSSDDLARARADLEKLESMLRETLQQAATATQDAVGEILRDLAEHSRLQGLAVGRQARETLTVIAQQMRLAGSAQASAGLHLARNTADLMRQFSAGVLVGLADRIRPDRKAE